MTKTTSLDLAFEKMVEACARDLFKSGDLIGLGSGSAVARFAKALGERAKKESLKISIIPSSMQSWLLATENGLEISRDSSRCPESLDAVIDGADQIALNTRSMIKGGGGALLKEKVIISSSKTCYILADESKFVSELSRSVPVEVVQFSFLTSTHKLEEFGAKPVLRKLDKGYPYYTESGNLILDCEFSNPISDPSDLEKRIKQIPGVVECGLFNCKVDKFFKANSDGTFESL